MTRKVSFCVLVFVMSCRATVDGAAGKESNARRAYLFTSSRGNGENGLHLAHSYDGYRWIDLNKVFLRPKVGKGKLMRDPCIIQGPDGTFHMVWTTGWWEKGDNNHRIYYVATRDFESFSKAELLYEHGFNVIDSTIIRDDGRYMMFLKDETLNPPQKNIRLATASAAEGPYSEPSQPITGEYWAEGPTAVKIADTWLVYFDKYRKHSYGLVISKDLKNWTDVSDKLELPEGSRHGTILQVSSRILDKLIGKK